MLQKPRGFFGKHLTLTRRGWGERTRTGVKEAMGTTPKPCSPADALGVRSVEGPARRGEEIDVISRTSRRCTPNTPRYRTLTQRLRHRPCD